MYGAMAQRIHKEVQRNNVVLYMKGSAAFPQCAASAAIVQILSSLGAPFLDVNAADDGELKQALIEYANWPNLPQLYIKGEFIGGADIVREMYDSGELDQLLSNCDIRH
jgi:monothiol glutaredoxin